MPSVHAPVSRREIQPAGVVMCAARAALSGWLRIVHSQRAAVIRLGILVPNSSLSSCPSASLRPSHHSRAAPNGAAAASQSTSPCICPEMPIACTRISTPAEANVRRRSARASTRARSHSAGSCSWHSGGSPGTIP